MTQALLGLGFALVALGAQQAPDLPPAPGKLVDIGGRRLHAICSGQGTPTIVLEAGASSFAIDWTLVQRQVDKTNRVCSSSSWMGARSRPATETMTPEISSPLRALASAPCWAGCWPRAPPFAPICIRSATDRRCLLSRGDEQNAEREAVHAALARLSTRGRHAVIAGAGQEIHLFQPDAVIAAITEVAKAVRIRLARAADDKIPCTAPKTEPRMS